VPEVDILELDLEMARFLVEHVKPNQAPRELLGALMTAVFGKRGLDIIYENTGTKTAIETFRSRSGNCLSFTILFIAMARHLGLNAYFQEVGEVISWDRRGDVVLLNQHMFVEVEMENAKVRVDFLPGAEKRYRLIRRISDRRAQAHYYNNLGVETLAAGDTALARAYFLKALEADERFSNAWTNLGVAYRLLGELELAEESHLRAMEIDPNGPTAITNLASLYLASGRQEQAEPLLRKVDDHLQRNPYHHFRLGRNAAYGGETSTAIRHFKEAIRRMPEEAEFHAALAEAYLQAGDRAGAEASLRRALELSEEEPRRKELQDRLEALDRQ
jgi:Flp pilus assembly protein TadD